MHEPRVSERFRGYRVQHETESVARKVQHGRLTHLGPIRKPTEGTQGARVASTLNLGAIHRAEESARLIANQAVPSIRRQIGRMSNGTRPRSPGRRRRARWIRRRPQPQQPSLCSSPRCPAADCRTLATGTRRPPTEGLPHPSTARPTDPFEGGPQTDPARGRAPVPAHRRAPRRRS